MCEALLPDSTPRIILGHDRHSIKQCPNYTYQHIKGSLPFSSLSCTDYGSGHQAEAGQLPAIVHTWSSPPTRSQARVGTRSRWKRTRQGLFRGSAAALRF